MMKGEIRVHTHIQLTLHTLFVFNFKLDTRPTRNKFFSNEMKHQALGNRTERTASHTDVTVEGTA